MKIPPSLKVGGHQIKVELVDPTDPELDGACGMFIRTNNRILIDKTLSRSQLEQSLIHEIFHALNWELKEEFIESFSQQIYQVFKDNNLLK